VEDGGEINYARLGEDSMVGQMSMNPRVVLLYDKNSMCTSSIVGQRNPQWGSDGTGENFLFSVTDKTFQTMLVAKVYSGAVEIGGCVVNIQDSSGDKGRTVDKFFELENEKGEYRGKLRLNLEYTKQTARRNELTETVKRIDIGNLQQTVTRTHIEYKDMVSDHTDFKDPSAQSVFDQRNLVRKLMDKLKTAWYEDLRLLKKRELQMGGRGEGMGMYIPVGMSQLRIGVLGGRELVPTNKKSILQKMGASSLTTSDVFVKVLFRPDTDMSHPDVVIGTTNTEYSCGGVNQTVDPIFGSNERPATVADASTEFQPGTDENAFMSEWESVKFYRFVGVTYEGESWRARCQGKDLGQFETEEKAAMAYDAYVRAQNRKGLFANRKIQTNFPQSPDEQPLQRRLDDDNSGYFQRMYKYAFAIGAGRVGMSPKNVMNFFCQPSSDNFEDPAPGATGMTQSGWAKDFADLIFEVYDEEKDDQFEGGRTRPKAMGECGIPMDILNDQSFKTFVGWEALPFPGGQGKPPSEAPRNTDTRSKNFGKKKVKAYNKETEYTYIGHWKETENGSNVWQMDDAEDGILMYHDEIVYRGQWQQGQLKMPLVLPVKTSVSEPWPDRRNWMGQIYVYIELIEQTPVTRAELEVMEERHNKRLDGAIRKEMEIFKPREQQDAEFRARLEKRWKQKCMSLIPGMPNSIPYRRSMTEYDDGLYPWFYECDHVLYQIGLVKKMMQNDIAVFTRALSREIEETKECMREVDQAFHDDYMNYCRSRVIANLDITIIEGLDLELPEAKDPSSKRPFNLADTTKSEPYIKFFNEYGHEIAKTKHRKSERNPKWNETFTLQVKTDGSRLIPERIRLQCFDHDSMFGDDSFLGEVWLEMAHIVRGVWIPSTEELPERYGCPGLKGNAEPPKCVKNCRIPGHMQYNEIAVAKYGKGKLAKQHFANEKDKEQALEASRLRRLHFKEQQNNDDMAAQASAGLLGQRGADVAGMNSGMGGTTTTRGLASLTMAKNTIYATDPYDSKEMLNYNPSEPVKVSRKGAGYVRPYQETDKDGQPLLNPNQADKILAVGTAMDIIVNNVDAGKWKRSIGTDAKFTANAPSGTADSANPRTERYEMRVGETEHTFQLMIDNPEKPILEVHCVIVKVYESGETEVILQMPPGKRWHWEHSWQTRQYWIMQVLPRNPYHIYDKLPTGRHGELEIIKPLREPEVCYSEEQAMELEGMFLYGIGQSGGFDGVQVGTHSEQEAHIDGWYNLKPIMPAPGQIFHTSEEDHNDLEHAEEDVPPMMRGFLRVKTTYTPVEVSQDDRESFDRIRDEKNLAEVMQGGQDEYLTEEIRQLMYNPALREKLRVQVPSILTRKQFWLLNRTLQVRNFMITNLLQVLMTQKCVKEDREDLIRRIKELFVNDSTVLERFPAHVFDPTASTTVDMSRSIGSFTVEIQQGRGLLPPTGDQIQRVFVSRYARCRVIGGSVKEGEETQRVQQYMKENKCTFQEYQHLTQDIGRAQKVSRAALGSNPMGFNQSSFNKFDQSVTGLGEVEETEFTRQDPSAPEKFGGGRSVPFYMFDESNLVRIEVIDRTKKLERVTLDEKKTFILPDSKHGKVAHEVKGVSTRQEDRYLEEEVCIGVVTVSYKELLTVFGDTKGKAFEQWFNVGPDTTFQLMSTMQMRQRYLKQKPRGRICVRFESEDWLLIDAKLKQRKASARAVRCQIESRTLLDEMRISMFNDGLSVSAFYTEFSDPVQGVITKESLTRGMQMRYHDRLFSPEAVEGVWNELDGSGVTLIAAKHTTAACKIAEGRYVEERASDDSAGAITINHKPVYRRQDDLYAIAFSGEHWVILSTKELEGLKERPRTGFSVADEKFMSNGTVEDEKRLITSAWSEFRIFRESQDGVVTFVEFCMALRFDPTEDPEFRDMMMPVNFLHTSKLEKWIRTLSNKQINMLLDKLSADGKNDVEERLQRSRSQREIDVAEGAKRVRDSLIHMIKYHASFGKKIKNIFHHDYIELLQKGGTYDIGGLREFKLFTAKPATLLIQIQAAEEFRLPMVDEIHSNCLYPSDLQLELIRQRYNALEHYYELCNRLANLQVGKTNHMSNKDLAAQGKQKDNTETVAYKRQVQRLTRQIEQYRKLIMKLNRNSQFRTGALSKGLGEASPFALLFPYIKVNPLAGTKNISVAKIKDGKDDDALLMAQNVKVVTTKGPLARKMHDYLTQIPAVDPRFGKTQPQTLFKVEWPKEVFKFDLNDVHMGAIDLNLMSDVPDGRARFLNQATDDMDYFGGDATKEDGSEFKKTVHKFGNAVVDERTKDSHIGSVRINCQDIYHSLADAAEKEAVARQHRDSEAYNHERHHVNALRRRCENLSGCEVEMVQWSSQRDRQGRVNKPEMKFTVVIQQRDWHMRGVQALWRDITDKDESDYSPVFEEYMVGEFKNLLNHPTTGRFSSLQSYYESSTYSISRDYICGSLRKDDRVHVIDSAFASQTQREGIVKGLDRNFDKNGLVKVEFGAGVMQSIHYMNLKNATADKGAFQSGGQVEYRAKDDLVERARLFDSSQVRLTKKKAARIAIDKIEIGPTGIRLTCRGPPSQVYSPAFGMADYNDGLAKGQKRSASHAAVGGKDLSHWVMNKASLKVLGDQVFKQVDNARKALREKKSDKSKSVLTARTDLVDVQLAIRVADQLYESLEPDNKSFRDLDAYVEEKWFFPLTSSEAAKLAGQLDQFERFSTLETDAHMQYESHEGGASITTCQWLPFEPSKAMINSGNRTAGRLKVKMKLQMRDNVEPYDTAEFVPHDDLVKILQTIHSAFGSIEKWLQTCSRDLDSEVQKVLKLQRDLGIRIRNEARMNVLTKKLNFMAAKEDKNPPRSIREFQNPEKRAEIRKEWLPDARTGQLEPILDLVDEVRMLCDKPEYRDLIKDRDVEIPRPMYHKDRGQNMLVGKIHPYATLVPEEEQLLPAELGQEDGQKVLQQELDLVSSTGSVTICFWVILVCAA
jgi:hypothetical protein